MSPAPNATGIPIPEAGSTTIEDFSAGPSLGGALYGASGGDDATFARITR